MKNNLLKVGFLTFALLVGSIQQTFAFSDIKGDAAKIEILDLRERGIINGVNNDSFKPLGIVTNAQAISLLSRTFDFNIDHLKFIKEPKIEDIYKNMKAEHWYATDFLYAYHNGLTLPHDVNPNDKITREQFADMLCTALTNKYDLAFIMLWNMIEDEEQIDSKYMSSIQNLLNSNIIKLEDGKFHPKQEITRSEAAVMLHRTISLIKDLETQTVPVDGDTPVSNQ